MTPFERLLESIVNNWQVDVWMVGKIGMLVLLVLYLLFSLVVIKQVKLMCRTISGVMDKGLLIAAKVLVGLAVAALVLGIIIL